MKITITEIEATAEDLRANRTLADALTMAFSRIANSICYPKYDTEEEEEEEEEDKT
jgi:hypothetical protein